MTEDEIADRTAINVLRDTIESGRLPCGIPLVPEVAELHKWVARHLEMLSHARRGRRRRQAGRQASLGPE